MSTPERGTNRQDEQYPEGTEDERASIREAAGSRGSDDRRAPVDPTQNPAPRSPEPDREAVEKGEETLERVKPY